MKVIQVPLFVKIQHAMVDEVSLRSTKYKVPIFGQLFDDICITFNPEEITMLLQDQRIRHNEVTKWLHARTIIHPGTPANDCLWVIVTGELKAIGQGKYVDYSEGELDEWHYVIEATSIEIDPVMPS